MSPLDDNRKFTRTFRQYSLWFAVFAFLSVIVFFIIDRKSMYNYVDGLQQQYAYFIYTGKWIRQLFNNLFVAHVFELPMWDMSIGMGSDSLIVFSSVANPLGDPVYWISAFIPYKAAEPAFDLTIIIKMYLSGLAFAYYSHCRKMPVSGTVTGALVYTFSAVTFIGFTQASILNVFYLFPLLMTGVDRMWNKQGYKLYVIALALCFINSFYFTYMMALMVAAYFIIRFCCDRSARSVRSFFSLLTRFAGFSLIGAGIGIGLQLPAIINLAGLDRLSLDWDIDIFDPEILKIFFTNSFSMMYVGHEGLWGAAPIAFAAIVMLFSERGKHLVEKVLFILFTAVIPFPAAGSLFNGLKSPTGRYMFGYVFLVAYIVALEYENILKINKKKLYIMLGISFGYLLLTALFTDLNGLFSGSSLLIYMIASVFISGAISSPDLKRILYTVTTLVTCMIIGLAHIHYYIACVQMDFGTSYDTQFLSNGFYHMSEDEISELHHVRYDYIPLLIEDTAVNSSMLLDAYGYDFYNSNYNNWLDKYYLDMGINSSPFGYMMYGLRGRNYLELMNGTKYIIIENGRDSVLYPPYSYDLVNGDEEFTVYRSSEDESLVYFYDNAIPYSAIEGLDPIHIEELMMHYCITDSASSSPADVYRFTKIDFNITDTRGIVFNEDNTITAEQDGYMILSFDEIADSEVSVYVNGIEADRLYADFLLLGHDGSYFICDTIEGRPRDDWYYHWKNRFVVNFGFTEQPVNTIQFIFGAGVYSIDDISIYARSEEQLNATIEDFREHADTDSVSYEAYGNHVHINAAADRDKYLYLTIPYSAGWTASVDGDPVPVERANIGFMAIPVSEGEHQIEFSYRTPYLTEGLCITALSLTAFIIISVYDKKCVRDSRKQ